MIIITLRFIRIIQFVHQCVYMLLVMVIPSLTCNRTKTYKYYQIITLIIINYVLHAHNVDKITDTKTVVYLIELKNL